MRCTSSAAWASRRWRWRRRTASAVPGGPIATRRVDIQSLEYSYSFSEELQQDWHWTERYAAQPELLRYANHVADRFDLRRDIRLNTRVAAAQFDEAARRWRVSSACGRRWTARFLILATGPLSSPNLPAFEGIERFAGQALHSAAWPNQPPELRGTAAYVVPAHNGPLDLAWEARIKADYAGFRARNRKAYSGFGSELTTIEASASAEAHWVAFVNATAETTVYLGCRSWYVGDNVPGKPHVFMPLASGFPAYAKRCAAVASSGYEGFVIET